MMRFSSLFFASAALTALSSVSADDAIFQSMYVPLPETQLFNEIFDVINSKAASPITSIISVAISTDDTVIYYDHWEDGYDGDVLDNPQGSTEVWGDGDASNGCAPIPGRSCSNASDKLNAGDVALLENKVYLPRKASAVKYDGGDKLQATRPVAMTRAGYPAGAGSLMAGAVEVFEQDSWGMSFEAPVGQDTVSASGAYEYVAMACQAGDAGAEVRVNGAHQATLSQGEAKIIRVNQGAKVTSTAPMQVHLITGDIGSTYELRWYALTPTEQWSNEAYAPVGDTEGKVAVTVYNPSGSAISVQVQTLTKTYTMNVPAGSSKESETIYNGSGAKFSCSGGNFFAFSSTDRVGNGQLFDWGYPLMTRDQLTNTVLIGLGYGCTDNTCDSKGERSVVWVTPVEDADVHIDFDNDGNKDETRSVRALASEVITDTDEDMSGAVIWATKKGSGPNGEGVDLAAAWGQKAALSGSNDGKALDLGTVVVPFEPVRTSCSVELIEDNDNDGKMSVGDVVNEIIEVVNAGQTALGAGTLSVMTLGGPIEIESTAPRGGVQTYVIPYTIPEGVDVSEFSCGVIPYVTASPTKSPTASPTKGPTKAPTASPTKGPTKAPTASPTKGPTKAPTKSPTDGPTKSPTKPPTKAPTKNPTDGPTKSPTKAPTKAPTKSPTDGPTKSPTKPPTDGPTEPPTASPTKAPSTDPPSAPPKTGPTDPPKGSGSGDPHFKTWTGSKFDYHGECDLVLVDNPAFADGLGLKLHIRTTRVKYFSFIEKVALQIGDDVLEFDNDVESFLINGEPVEENKKHHKTMLSGFIVRRDAKALSVRLVDDKSAAARQSGMIAKIDFHTRKNGFPAVIVDAGHTDIFKGSLGLLGEYGSGIKLARDGKTELEMDGDDATTFALEWQVRDTEPMLFKDTRSPQFPTVCTPPAKMRVGSSQFKAEAEEACAHWKTDMEDCIFDVMATRDILVAEEGHIVHVE